MSAAKQKKFRFTFSVWYNGEEHSREIDVPADNLKEATETAENTIRELSPQAELFQIHHSKTTALS